MLYSNSESATAGPINLLKNYSFESTGLTYEKVLDSWLERFPLIWVNLALVESLYQGRYKVISVEQILTLWQRRGKPSHHFTSDFERLVSHNLPQPFDGDVQSPRLPNSRRQARETSWQIRDWSNHVNAAPKASRSEAQLESRDAEDHQPLDMSYTSASDESDAVDNISLPISSLQNNNASHLTSQAEEQVDEVLDWDALLNLNLASESFEEIKQEDEDFLRGESTMDAENDSSLSALGQTSSELPCVDSRLGEDEQDSSVYPAAPFQSAVNLKIEPIHRFVPQSESSDFYSKLTAMAQVNV